MFLRLKRDGSIKGIPVAGGNRQRELISKEDVIYPSVATEEVLLACIVDTQEGRYVVIVDTPKNFILLVGKVRLTSWLECSLRMILPHLILRRLSLFLSPFF